MYHHVMEPECKIFVMLYLCFLNCITNVSMSQVCDGGLEPECNDFQIEECTPAQVPRHHDGDDGYDDDYDDNHHHDGDGVFVH